VYADSDMGREVGLVSCAGSCSPGKTERVVEVVRQEYARLGAEGVQAAELADTCAQIKSQLVFGSEGVMNQMYRLAKDEIYFGRSIPLTELVDQIDAVDPESVRRCARKYFHPDNLVVAIHGPR
jgi:predicted Zn-dependent peptidase